MADEKKDTGTNKLPCGYNYAHNVNLKQEMICGSTGIRKAFGDLTADDCEKMIKAGNTSFTKSAAAEKK